MGHEKNIIKMKINKLTCVVVYNFVVHKYMNVLSRNDGRLLGRMILISDLLK